MAQTAYTQAPAQGPAGLIADTSFANHVDSFVAQGAPVPGLLVARGTAADQQVIPIAAVAAASATAILASGGASAATAQVITGATFNGTTGTGRIVPAQLITVTLNSHANWTTGPIVVTGEDANGNRVEEHLEVPSGGNATLTTKQPFARVISLNIPAQGGTSGTYTVGLDPAGMAVSLRDFPGVAIYDSTRSPYVSGAYEDKDPCPVLGKGRIFVAVETACTAGDVAWVRMVLSGNNVRGQFDGGLPAAASFARFANAKFLTTQATAGGIAVLEIR